MSLRCNVCGEDYSPAWGISEANAVCADCFMRNFAGAQPPLDAWGTARETLEAYVDQRGPYRLTPRQEGAMRQLIARWAEQADTP